MGWIVLHAPVFFLATDSHERVTFAHGSAREAPLSRNC